MSRFLPPSKVQDAEVNNSVLGDGCVIRAGTTITHSVIGLRSLIGERCRVEDALMMGADYYETLEECALIPGCLPMGLGALPRPLSYWGINGAAPDPGRRHDYHAAQPARSTAPRTSAQQPG